MFDDPAGFALWVNNASDFDLSSTYKEWCDGDFDLVQSDQIILINKIPIEIPHSYPLMVAVTSE